MGTDGVVDRGSDGWKMSRIGQTEQLQNAQGLSETEVSGDH